MKDYSRLAAGFLVGAVLATAALATRAGGTATDLPRPDMDVLHTPPFLTSADGHDVRLRYGVVCAPLTPEPPKACRPSGTVYVRGRTSKTFEAIPPSRVDGRMFEFRIPNRDAEYHAEFTDGRGSRTRLPLGAEHRLWTVDRWRTIDLEEHEFGRVREPNAVIAEAPWGPSGAGLNSGPEQARIGPSAFDVAPDGTVVVLDQAQRRLAVFDGSKRRFVPIDFIGGEGDLAVAPDGTTWVLDDGGSRTASPVVRAYSRTGSLRFATELRAPLGDMVRVGPTGPVVHTYPSELWLPIGSDLPGSAGRPVESGQLVVSATRDEARFAIVSHGRVARAWRIRSGTNLGEVQLADAVRDDLVVVVRVWTEDEAEFRVLRLSTDGLVQSFSVPTGEWAESASLSRFRLRGTTLYQLRSSPRGLRIVSYDLGGAA